MRSWIEIAEGLLSEKTIRLDGQDGIMFIVTKNPSRQQYHSMLASVTDEDEIKGILTERDLYYWSGWHAHHHEIAERLGLGVTEWMRIFIQKNAVVAQAGWEKPVCDHPQLQFLYSGRVPFAKE